MSSHRYIIGSPERHAYPLKSTHRAPIVNNTTERVGYARFPTHDDGTGREHSLLYVVKRGGIIDPGNGGGFVTKETDDPDLVAQIDAASARTAAALAAWREAQREEREVLALLIPRCKPARVRESAS